MSIFRRLPWMYQIGAIVVLVVVVAVLGYLALQQFQAGGAVEQPDATVDVGGAAQWVPQGEQPQGVHVVGVGEVARIADMMVLVFGIKVSGDSAVDTVKQMQESTAALEKTIRDLEGLDLSDVDMEIGTVALHPVFQADNGQNVPVSYVANTTATIRLDEVSLTYDLLDAVAASGQAQLLDMRHSLSDEQQIQQDALRLATLEAAGKAHAIADAIQGRIAGLINIREELTIVPPSRDGLAEQALHPGQIRVRAVVHANFAFE